MIQNIKQNIFSVGATDPKRELFDALIPLPDGTSYNSYLIKGSEKTALIDTVDPTKTEILLKNLKELGAKIDYIIANHAEQDHSGSLKAVLDKNPKAKIVCTDKCKPMLMELLCISEEQIMVVNDKEKLVLGDKTLEFIYTPWVHWPETMCTYLHEDKILFSCDFFGSHFAAEDLFKYDPERLYKAAKRYFAEIMMPFRVMIKRNIETLSGYDIKLIAPSHGPVYEDPKTAIDWYKEWISDDVKNLAIVAYVSMHGSTKEIADRLCEDLTKKGVNAHKYDLTGADIGELAIDLVDAATIVVGTPCLLGAIHPTAVHAVYLVNALRPKTRFASVIASFGWGGRIVDEIVPMIKNLKVEIIPPVIVKGFPKDADFKEIERLAQQIAEKHKGLAK